MKNLFLKNISKKAIISTIMLISCVGYNAKANDMLAADSIMAKFKRTLEAFFTGNTKTRQFFIDEFAIITSATQNLINQIEAKQQANPTATKYKDFLVVLRKIKRNIQEMYDALKDKYFSAAIFALYVGKVFKKYGTSAHIADLKVMFNKIRSHLNKKEEDHLNNIIKTLETLHQKIPKSKIVCLKKLRAVYKN